MIFSKLGQVRDLRRPVPTRRAEYKIDAALNARFWQNLRMGTMSTSEGIQKRNAFAAFAAFRIEGLEVSLNHARESAVREELAAVEHYIEEAQGYLAQIRILHEEALTEFSRAQRE